MEKPSVPNADISLLCGKSFIAAESGAAGIATDHLEMICGVSSQARDIRSHILVIISRLDLVGRS